MLSRLFSWDTVEKVVATSSVVCSVASNLYDPCNKLGFTPFVTGIASCAPAVYFGFVKNVQDRFHPSLLGLAGNSVSTMYVLYDLSDNIYEPVTNERVFLNKPTDSELENCRSTQVIIMWGTTLFLIAMLKIFNDRHEAAAPQQGNQQQNGGQLNNQQNIIAHVSPPAVGENFHNPNDHHLRRRQNISEVSIGL